MLRSGALGRVLSAGVVSTTAGLGAHVGDHDAYLEDPAAGMNLLTIQGAHTVDLLVHLLGGLASVSVVASVLHPHPTVGDTGRTVARVLPDHVLAHGRLESGAPFSVEVAGGRPASDTPFRLEVVTERGILAVAGGAARGFQSSVLALSLDGEVVELGWPGWQCDLPASAVDVSGLYAALVRDVVDGTSTAPDFDTAADLAQLVDGLRAAADEATPRAVLTQS